MLRFIFIFNLFFGFLSASDYEINWLSSFPRSGNHWMRFLLEDYTGVATASEYQDHIPPHLPEPFSYGYVAPNGYLGNCRYAEKGEKVIVKTHYPFFKIKKLNLQNCKIIRIVRNPIDCFYSLKNYLGNKDKYIPNELLEKFIYQWKEYQNFWNNQKNVLTIRYESLLLYPEEVFKDVLNFLEYEINEQKIHNTISNFPPQDYAFKHLSNYTDSQKNIIRIQLKNFLYQFNYEIP